MSLKAAIVEKSNGGSSIDDLIAHDANLLSSQLKILAERLYSPEESKHLRRFTSAEAAKILGVTDSYIRHLATQVEGVTSAKTSTGRRTFSLEEVNTLRQYLGKSKPAYIQERRGSEHLQVIAVTNFKGGSGKTTTAIHLAQYLALHGYRVLAVDLDPQASMSAMVGVQPEFDVLDNQTLYGAIRYDDERRDVREIIRKTYFPGLDLIPANLELHEFEHTTPTALAQQDRKATDMFFARVGDALHSVEADYDVVVIDCPPTLGYLTLSALCAATSTLITVHPQMLDVASMNQFLAMTSELLSVVKSVGGDLHYDWMRYVITRNEVNDGPQAQIVAFLRNLYGERVLTAMMVKSTGISDAGLSKQTIYEAGRETMNRQTYDRAVESMDAVNAEIELLLRGAWGERMKGRDILKGLSEQPKSEKDVTPQAHRTPGAVRSMSLNLNRLNEEAAEGRALREAIASGQSVVELDPATIETSFIRDRIQDDGDPSFEALKSSIRESGQQVPILVRPHPASTGTYQVAYGHRRLRAAADLGTPVRAIVRGLSDEQLVIAQGQENGDRIDLSFIERALFARRLDEHGFDRDMIVRVLSIDKPELSRLLQVAQAITPDLILAIGPAPKVGRPRWLAMMEKLKDGAARKSALSKIAEPGFSNLESNKRFDNIWKAVSTKTDSNDGAQTLRTRKGIQLGAVARGKSGMKITITSADFADFLTSRMAQIVADFEAE